MDPLDDWTAEDDAYLDELNEQRARNGLPPMSRDEYLDGTDEGNAPEPEKSREERLLDFNALRASNGQPPFTAAEFDVFEAMAPRFDWEGTRQYLLQCGWDPNHWAIQHCLEMAAKEAERAKALETTKGLQS